MSVATESRRGTEAHKDQAKDGDVDVDDFEEEKSFMDKYFKQNPVR